MNIVTASELERLKIEQPGLVVVDVRLAADFQAGHIPEAVGHCVFEIEFLKQLSKSVSDKANPVCVYGASESSFESRIAAEKLQRAGYENVFDLRGGMESWRAAGLPVESNGKAASLPRMQDGTHPIDLSQSVIEWAGRNLANRHWGTLKFKTGEVSFHGSEPQRGFFIIDMHSITDLNLEDFALRKVLEDHLKIDDFFDVEQFPEAEFELAKITRTEKATPGLPNYKISGSLMLKDATNAIEFPATGGINADHQWVFQAHFDFDRTRWNVLYGSGKFFTNLGMHLVNDLVSLQIKIVI